MKIFPSGFAVNPAYPFLGCSPDAKVIDQAAKDCPFGIIEIKCPYKHRDVTPMTAWNGDKDFHLEIKDSFPVLKTSHRYYYQVQGQLGILLVQNGVILLHILSKGWLLREFYLM